MTVLKTTTKPPPQKTLNALSRFEKLDHFGNAKAAVYQTW